MRGPAKAICQAAPCTGLRPGSTSLDTFRLETSHIICRFLGREAATRRAGRSTPFRRGEGRWETDVDDAYLVQRAQEGYLDAYAELVDRHGRLAYRVALRLLGNHHDAEDIAQEALVAAWQQLPRFKANSSFSTWLYRIVTRRALNRISRTRATDSLDLLGDVTDSDNQTVQAAERDLAVDAVTNAVTALPPPQRVAIVLRHFEELSHAEIARITGSSIPAVRSHLFRGRRTLAQTLEDWR